MIFGKKKKNQHQETTYDVFGGCTITKSETGYQIIWRSPQLTTVTVNSKPSIDPEVEVETEDDKIQVLSRECRLRIFTKENRPEAKISKL